MTTETQEASIVLLLFSIQPPFRVELNSIQHHDSGYKLMSLLICNEYLVEAIWERRVSFFPSGTCTYHT